MKAKAKAGALGALALAMLMLAGCGAVSICLCRERLLRKKIPREWNDLAVDIVITEERALRIK